MIFFFYLFPRATLGSQKPGRPCPHVCHRPSSGPAHQASWKPPSHLYPPLCPTFGAWHRSTNQPFISEYLHTHSLCLNFCVPVELCSVDWNKISNSSAGACITLDVVPLSRVSLFFSAVQIKPRKRDEPGSGSQMQFCTLLRNVRVERGTFFLKDIF